MTFTLNCNDAIYLDAEELAEGDIANRYESMLPRLRQFIQYPARIEEFRNDEVPSYSVRCGGSDFAICGPALDQGNSKSWGRATVALFCIVNEQLKNASHRFYAINGGNELLGLFLTPAEAVAAQKSLPNKCDWPYIPQDEEPWFGQFH